MNLQIFTSSKLIIFLGTPALHFVGVVALFNTLFLNQARAQFYVSPGGNDSDSGTSTSAPFRTLARADSAMKGSSVKTTYLMGGTYNQTSVIRPSFNTSWIGYSGQTPVLDGSNSGNNSIFRINANNVTINGLTIKNAYVPIDISNADGVVIRNNTILNSRLRRYTGVIHASAKVTHLLISHNLIDSAQGRGISIDSGSDATLANTSSDITIEYNLVYNTNTSGGATFNSIGCDVGAIYFNDRPYASKNNIINNNIIKNYGTNSFGYPGCYNIVAIYLDDEQSNVTITNNIVYGNGEYGLLLHGSDHCTISNNIFHLNGVINAHGENQVGFYQSVEPNHGMDNNVFTKNIIYTTGISPSKLWNHNEDGGPMTNPNVHGNLYFSTVGILPNSGEIIDKSQLVSNPLFVNPTNLSGTNYALQPNSPAITQLGFVPIDDGQYGPQTGTIRPNFH
jgi:parallel beta-helix repeat protein